MIAFDWSVGVGDLAAVFALLGGFPLAVWRIALCIHRAIDRFDRRLSAVETAHRVCPNCPYHDLEGVRNELAG